MTLPRLFLAAWLLTLTTAAVAPAQQVPTYARDIQPFFHKYCVECHNAKKPRMDLNLETFKGLQQGSENGAVLVPGQAEQSKLVLLVEGKKEPKMPPKTATTQPRPEEVARLRAWVNAGAVGADTVFKVVLPVIPSRVKPAAPITALCWLPDGQHLVAGSYRQLWIIGPKTENFFALRHEEPGTVTALACSKDGRTVAVACGTPGTPATLRLYAVPPEEKIWAAPRDLREAHADVIQQMAFSPDSKTLLTCGYDRQVKVWDVASGKVQKTLKEHSDSIYGVSFRPDGLLFATGAADRAVKVWGAKSGKLLYTLGEATDWVYAVAWSPDGQHLAAAGVDKSIRVWQVDEHQGKVVQSVFAHQAPVIALAYAPDGRTLYSLSEDRTLKAWDAATMSERKVYPPQPETPLSLAVAPDGRHIALGRYDGTLLLIDDKTGQTTTILGKESPEGKTPKKAVQVQPVPAKPQPPQVKKVTPDFAARGQTVRLTFEGAHLGGVNEIKASFPGAKITFAGQGRTDTRLLAELIIPADTSPDSYQLFLKNAAGDSAPVSFNVDAYPAVREGTGDNNSPGTGSKISLPATVVGAIDRAGDVDYFRFQARAGQQLGVSAQTTLVKGQPAFTPYLMLTDASGQELIHGEKFLGYTFPHDGVYALGIRDRQFGGSPGWTYRLHLGDIPVVTAVFPLGLQRGTETTVAVEGVHLGGIQAVRVKADAQAAPGSKVAVPISTRGDAPLGSKQLVVGEFPEVQEKEGTPLLLPIPGTANGRISRPGETDLWRFHARKGQKLILEVHASRLGAPLDSYLEVLNAAGQPIPRATLRSLAKTYVTFRDHDSVGAGIRIEAWSELAVNDYIYAGTELLRIQDLPPNPDADCTFFSVKGRRTGFLDTTPTHLAKDEPMYKVAIHPPGTTFPENGYPVVTLFYRNDDGPAGFGRDSRLVFDPPADGDYQVRIGDSNGQGGSQFAYRLTIRPPRPSYNVTFAPTSPSVWQGGAIPITVTAERIDDYVGPINVHLENLPPGFSAPATTIPAGEESTTFALWADAGTKTPANGPPLKLVAEAQIDGQPIRREVVGGMAKTLEPGDLVTTAAQSEVLIRPGGETRLTVQIERRKGFQGRVPIEVLGLPHGVKVLDVGLNGILINENETRRTMVFSCLPWVQPQEHPIVITARREGTSNQFAAKSVLLKIVPAGK